MAAEQHGYTVSFEDLGHALDESMAVSDPDFKYFGQDIGASTQARHCLPGPIAARYQMIA